MKSRLMQRNMNEIMEWNAVQWNDDDFGYADARKEL